MSSKASFLDLLTPLTKEEIQANSYAHENLWLIQYDLETKGPFHESQLDELARLHAKELSECMTCNLKKKNWKPFFEHKRFQKRTPKIQPVLKAEEKNNSRFYTLINGQKLGPYTEAEIHKQLDKGDLTMKNLISADYGKSWRKIYHFKSFDRREKSAQDLTLITPQEDQFEKSKIFTNQFLEHIQHEKKNSSDLEEALLASHQYLHKKKKQAAQDTLNRINVQFLRNNDNEGMAFNRLNLNKQNIIRVAIVLLVVIFGFSFFLDTSSNKKNSKVANSPSVENMDTETKRTRRVERDVNRENARKTRAVSSAKKSRTRYSQQRTRSRNNQINNEEINVPRRTSRYRTNRDNEDDRKNAREDDERIREDDRDRRSAEEDQYQDDDIIADDREFASIEDQEEIEPEPNGEEFQEDPGVEEFDEEVFE
ncbi:MAG: hypothetical protein H6621_11765 [Halobacteriovoraceae bacterium]|nr:hypothetical protein [Halobacteriovoraceae bacterium]MCB9095737.1 hypothetical protein [Halobacteriovoraceae bacterium]